MTRREGVGSMRLRPKAIVGIASLALAVSLGSAQQAHKGNSPEALLLAAELQAQGSYLGVHLSDIDPDRAATLKLAEARGVEVVGVQPGTPAAKAGFKAGDVILTYNGENVLGAQQLGRLVAETPPGRHIKIQYWRDGKQGETTVITAAPEMFPNVLQFRNFVPPQDWSDRAKLEEQLMRLQASTFEIPTPIMIWKNSLLGFWCEPIDDQLAQYFGVKSGVLVRAIDKDGPADKAGVKAGDIVTAIGDRSVSGPHDVTSYLRSQSQPVKSVTVRVTRNRKPLTFHILVGEQQ
jgi:serine protease Do